jgi:hypothetical protein
MVGAALFGGMGMAIGAGAGMTTTGGATGAGGGVELHAAMTVMVAQPAASRSRWTSTRRFVVSVAILHSPTDVCLVEAMPTISWLINRYPITSDATGC